MVQFVDIKIKLNIKKKNSFLSQLVYDWFMRKIFKKKHKNQFSLK